MKTKLISLTKPVIDVSPDEMVAYTARVSNPNNQMNVGTAPKLLAYLIKHKHWSPFEMVNMCVEIQTSRAIAAQMLRHRSFSFQEFSQRYSAVDMSNAIEPVEVRLSATNNRQSSTVSTDDWDDRIAEHNAKSIALYGSMIASGVATETARMVLPLSTKTTLYMNGTIRSWIHYLEQRCDEHTQKEHRDIALQIRDILFEAYPTIHAAIFGNTEGHQE